MVDIQRQGTRTNERKREKEGGVNLTPASYLSRASKQKAATPGGRICGRAGFDRSKTLEESITRGVELGCGTRLSPVGLASCLGGVIGRPGWGPTLRDALHKRKVLEICGGGAGRVAGYVAVREIMMVGSWRKIQSEHHISLESGAGH